MVIIFDRTKYRTKHRFMKIMWNAPRHISRMEHIVPILVQCMRTVVHTSCQPQTHINALGFLLYEYARTKFQTLYFRGSFTTGCVQYFSVSAFGAAELVTHCSSRRVAWRQSAESAASDGQPVIRVQESYRSLKHLFRHLNPRGFQFHPADCCCPLVMAPSFGCANRYSSRRCVEKR